MRHEGPHDLVKGKIMPVIEVRGLTKRFGQVLAVDQMSFDVEAGTVTGFLGSNGAGKTTTLRMLLGLIRPDAGTATICGQAYRDLEQPLHQVGAVLEASSFHPGRTARNHLRVQAMAGQADPARIDDVLGLVELGGVADRRVGGFSLGMRQRLGLATALLTDPDLLILDGPTAWTRREFAGCVTCCAAWPRRVAPCWCPAISWPRWPRPWTRC